MKTIRKAVNLRMIGFTKMYLMNTDWDNTDTLEGQLVALQKATLACEATILKLERMDDNWFKCFPEPKYAKQHPHLQTAINESSLIWRTYRDDIDTTLGQLKQIKTMLA
jgi:hypothetical protein